MRIWSKEKYKIQKKNKIVFEKNMSPHPTCHLLHITLLKIIWLEHNKICITMLAYNYTCEGFLKSYWNTSIIHVTNLSNHHSCEVSSKSNKRLRNHAHTCSNKDKSRSISSLKITALENAIDTRLGTINHSKCHWNSTSGYGEEVQKNFVAYRQKVQNNMSPTPLCGQQT